MTPIHLKNFMPQQSAQLVVGTTSSRVTFANLQSAVTTFQSAEVCVYNIINRGTFTAPATYSGSGVYIAIGGTAVVATVSATTVLVHTITDGCYFLPFGANVMIEAIQGSFSVAAIAPTGGGSVLEISLGAGS
jgi:hypothetical protein